MFFKKKKYDKYETNFDFRNVYKAEDNVLSAYKKFGSKPIRLLFELYFKQKKSMAKATVFYILKDISPRLIPIVTAFVIDIAVYRPQNSSAQFISAALYTLIIILANIGFFSLHLKSFSSVKRNVEAGIRGAMVRKLQQLNMTYHNSTASGKIQSKIIRDVEAVDGLVSQFFGNIVSSALSLIIAIGVIAAKNLFVLGVFLILVPIIVILRKIFIDRLNYTNRTMRIAVEHVASDVNDMVELMPVTRAHALENVEINKLTGELSDFAKKGYDLDKVQGIFGAGLFAFSTMVQLVCLLFTGVMAFKKYISIGDITLYQSYFNMLVNCITGFVGVLPMLSKGLESVKSIGEIINDPQDEDSGNKQEITELYGNYNFCDVEFCYDQSNPVLKGLNLEVKEGETVALVGESGGGKSTIINLLIGFNRVNKGKILIDGKNINDINLHSYRRFISIVPQNTVLFSGTVRDNITYGRPDISEQEVNYVVKLARLESVVANLPNGLDTLVGEHGSKLSGGQRQRISIARAIIRHPNVIIFDEATSALDTATEKEIQEAINNLTIGRTTFIVAHRLSTIKNVDKIAVIKDGRCVEIGSYKELLSKKGEFYKLKELQS